MKRIIIVLISLIAFTACFHKKAKVQKSHSFSKVLRSKDYEFKYKMAEQYYNEKKYSFAQQLYEDLFPYIKGTDRYEDMFYKVAYCYYYQKDYPNAENYFKTFTETFPSSNRTEECDYMRAYTYLKQSPKAELDQTNTTKALGLMQAFINTHPTSPRVKDATQIIDECREKLELKEYKSALLYYNMGYYKAASIAFANLYENYPDSKKADEYKLQSIKGFYKYAEMSYPNKQVERFEKIVADCADFTERYNDSKHITEIKKIKSQSLDYLKNLKNLKYE
jgi:outer membrane protein assembly factor BamD